MSTVRRHRFKQSDVTRALKGAEKAGLKPSGYRIDPLSGAIEVVLSGEVVAASVNSFDALMRGG